MKLNIQRFSSTNATTHYELSQYIGTDKPTYLVDYNSDMNKIDTAIYGADSQATQNANNIGTMSNLNTTEKSSLVGAINEVNTQVGTNTNNISTNTSNIGTLGTNQGVMANLTTTEKSSLVGAINEVDAENTTQNTNISKNASDIQDIIDYLNINTFVTIDNTDITSTNGTITSSTKVRMAYNSDASLFKLYGRIVVFPTTAGANWKISFPSNLRPTEEYTIQNGATLFGQAGAALSNSQYPVANSSTVDITVKTNGVIELTSGDGYDLGRTGTIILSPCLYFNKNFGD